MVSDHRAVATPTGSKSGKHDIHGQVDPSEGQGHQTTRTDYGRTSVRPIQSAWTAPIEERSGLAPHPTSHVANDETVENSLDEVGRRTKDERKPS